MIVMSTEAEARRFCRRYHRMPFSPKVYGWRYILTARVLQ